MANLGDVPTWAIAVGTVGTLAAALWQIGRERAARRHDEEQAVAAARRDQAQRISAWFAGDDANGSKLSILNASYEPVYQAVVTLVFIQGAGPQRGEDYSARGMSDHRRAMLSVIPPGRWTASVEGGWHGMFARPGAEIAFTDRAGIHWVRRGNGNVEELPMNAIDHFGIGRPVSWTIPEGERS
jgi:hypothetical protein